MTSPSREALRIGAKQAEDFAVGIMRRYNLTKEEVEQLFDKYIEEKKNVESTGYELDQRGSEDVERKSEVIHEVQD